MGVPADDASAAADAQRRARSHDRDVRDGAALSPDSRSARGSTRAEYNRARRGTETTAHRAIRLAANAARAAEGRDAETPAHRAMRRAADAGRAAKGRDGETPAQRAERQTDVAGRAQARRARHRPAGGRDSSEDDGDYEEEGPERVWPEFAHAQEAFRGEEKHTPELYRLGRMDDACPSCNALHWREERTSKSTNALPKFGTCCQNGQVQLPAIRDPPEPLKTFLKAESPQGRRVVGHLRTLNNALALAAVKSKPPPPLPGGSAFQPSVRLNGRLTHVIGPLLPGVGQQASFLQAYFTDSEDNAQRLAAVCAVSTPDGEGAAAPGGVLRRDVSSLSSPERRLFDALQDLYKMLLEHNSLVRGFLTAHERVRELEAAAGRPIQELRVVIDAEARPEGAHVRVYNAPEGRGVDEVAGLLPSSELEVSPEHAEEGRVPTQRDVSLAVRGPPAAGSAGGGPAAPQRVLQSISAIHPSYETATYPLLLPHGTDGWHIDIPRQNQGNRQRVVTAHEYLAYRLFTRSENFNALHRCGRLFGQWVVDCYIRVEHLTLTWMRFNQSKLRYSEWSRLVDAVVPGEEPAERIGRGVYLPDSFTGSPRYMRAKFAEAMTMYKELGAPTFFITMTCRPTWDEIKVELLAGQDSKDRPDLISRVFELKNREMHSLVTAEDVMGRCNGYLSVREFQKRGLPHVHDIIFLHKDDAPRSAQEYDRWISAEIPPETAPALRKLVLEANIHGPCGTQNPTSPCMKDGKCSKFFPKTFVSSTTDGDGSYPEYRRRSPEAGGRTATVTRAGQTFTVDNSWVVPYSPQLTLQLGCHVNVEIVSGVSALKYLFKYVTKGPDSAMMAVVESHVPAVDGGSTTGDASAGTGSNPPGSGGAASSGAAAAGNEQPAAPVALQPAPVDEIRAFQDARVVSESEAVARALGHPIHKRKPSVLRLALHLENQQPVLFKEGSEEAAIGAGPKATTLTAFFALSSAVPDGLSPAVRELLYSDMPKYFTWVQSQRKWKRRADAVHAGCVPKQLGRVNTVHPSLGDVYYLRLLLQRVEGPQSFLELRTYQNIVHPSYRLACAARGMLADNEGVWKDIMEEAVRNYMPYQIRDLFAALVVHGPPPDVPSLFDTYFEAMAEDVVHRLEARVAAGLDLAAQDNDVRRYVMLQIEGRILDAAVTLAGQGVLLPASTLGADGQPVVLFGEAAPAEHNEDIPSDAVEGRNGSSFERLLAHEMPADRAAQLQDALSRISTLVPDQLAVFNAIRGAIDGGGIGRKIFLMAPGGCGKTYLASMLLAYCRGQGHAALAVASSGVAANLMPLGRTAHSRFKIPIDTGPNSSCGFAARSDTARLLQRTRLIVWDEATMAHRHTFEAVKRSIKDTIGDEAAGRITWLLCGGFEQIPPVVRRGSVLQIVRASIRKSPMWPDFTVMELSTNMRVQRCLEAGNVEESRLLDSWAKWLLAVGRGTVKAARSTPEPFEAVSEDEAEEEEAPAEASLDARLQADLNGALPSPEAAAGVAVQGGSGSRLDGLRGLASLAVELATTAVCIPRALCQKAGKGVRDLLLATFPDIETIDPANPQDCVDKLSGRMVLTPLNEDVKMINRQALELFPGEGVQSVGVNQLVDAEEDGEWGEVATTEFMDSVDHASIPDQDLQLKQGMVVMLLRNLASQSGDCNGTRYIVTRVGSHSLGARRMSDGTEIIIPKLFLTPADIGLPFEMKRFQFPVRAAFAATINKAQGSTLERLGIWLRDSVFGHGQLYVALFRVGDPRKVVVGALSAAYDSLGRIVTNNVVYSQLFNNTVV